MTYRLLALGLALGGLLPLAALADEPALQTSAISKITRVSTTSSGKQISDGCWESAISPDGRYVAFGSYDEDIVPPDTNNMSDIFIKELATGKVMRVTLGPGGAEANHGSWFPAFTPDSKKLAFISDASNLVAGDTNAAADIFLYTIASHTLKRVSTTYQNKQANKASGTFSFSTDGKWMVFDSLATNLVAGGTKQTLSYLFRKDLTTGAVTRITPTNVDQGTWGPAVSPDGKLVAFASWATNLVAGDTNGKQDLFIYDFAKKKFTRISTTGTGKQSNGESYWPSFSPDSKYLFFNSMATNLVAGDTNAANDVFRKSLVDGKIRRVSVTATKAQANGGSDVGHPSADGKFYVFVSYATNLVSGDTNDKGDVFVKNLSTEAVSRVSTSASGAQSNGDSFISESFQWLMVTSGKLVAFESAGSKLVSGDTNGTTDIFVVKVK